MMQHRTGCNAIGSKDTACHTKLVGISQKYLQKASQIAMDLIYCLIHDTVVDSSTQIHLVNEQHVTSEDVIPHMSNSFPI